VLNAVGDFFIEGGDFMYGVFGVALLVLLIAANHGRVLIRSARAPAAPLRRQGRGLRYLSALGCLAVLLGVLGAVYGLIEAIHCCCLLENKAAFIAKHLSEVMNCTVFGLATAIVALLLHCLFGQAPEESRRHSALMRASVICLLCLLTCFLAMGMSLVPTVGSLPVRFERNTNQTGEDGKHRDRNWRLMVAPDRYIFYAPGSAQVEIPRGNLWRVTSTLRNELDWAGRTTNQDRPGFVVQCHDAISLQELVSVLDACRAAGFSDICITDS